MINQDSFGNTYLGYMNALENGVSITQADFNTFLNTAIGSNRYFIESSVNYNILLPALQEPFSPPVNTFSKGRFRLGFGGGAGSVNASNNNSSRTTINTLTPGSSGGYANASFFTYAVCNSSSLVIAQLGRTGNNFTGTQSLEYFGYLKNSAYTGANAILGASILGVRTAGATNTTAARPSGLNSSTPQDYATSGSVANYPITCSVATPGATTSDLVLRDNTGSNFAIGACHNLIKTTASISVGQVYNLTSDPDGNTEQTKWLCVGNWGTERLLMRIWTENII